MENDVAGRERAERDASACIMRHQAFAVPPEDDIICQALPTRGPVAVAQRHPRHNSLAKLPIVHLAGRADEGSVHGVERTLVQPPGVCVWVRAHIRAVEDLPGPERRGRLRCDML